MEIIHNITEGGQLTTHSIRMLKQVLKTALLVAVVIWIVSFAYFMSQLPYKSFRMSWYHLEAYFFSGMAAEEMRVDPSTWHEITHQRINKNGIMKTSLVTKYTQSYANSVQQYAIVNSITASYISLTSFLVVFSLFFMRGMSSKRKQHIAGNKIVAAWIIALKLKLRQKASFISLGSLPLVKGTETQHILVTGGTGSGKTNCFHHILEQIREKGQKAIIVDTTGVFVERYFNPNTDILLKPGDPRSRSWHPWIEIEENIDYDSLAEDLIPKSHDVKDDYWRQAARALFSSVLQKTNNVRKTTSLVKWLLMEPLVKLSEFVQGTKAAAHIDMSSERTAGSVRSFTSSFLECFEKLEDTENPFSIRKWVNDKDQKGWVFLACEPQQRACFIPLISCWSSIATRCLFSLKQDFERRLWFVIDELPTLHRLKNLESFITESRKYGGCALLSLQSPAQLESIYGRDAAGVIIGNCATKIVFTERNPETAERISKIFGQQEVKEFQKGLSYGANDVRDGVNLTLQTNRIPIVWPTAIQSLKKNQAFISLPEGYPITKIKLRLNTMRNP